MNAARKERGYAAVPLLFALITGCAPAIAQDAPSFDAGNFSVAKQPSRSAISSDGGQNAVTTLYGSTSQVFNVPQFNLRGKVEARDKLELLSRPIAGYDELGRSVEVLSGAAGALQGRVEDQSLDATLRNDNFNLRKLNPRADLGSNGLATMGNMMSNGFSWGIGDGGGIRMWQGWRNFSGGGGGGNANWQPDWSAFAWDPSFDSRRVQSNVSWANQFKARGRLMPDGSHNEIPWSIAGAQTLPQIEERQIVWDAWYQNISKALYARWQNPGEHPDSLLAAVQSLNGSSALDFPQQSAKTTVSFDSVFSAGLDTVHGAFSDRHNETERIMRR
jgi:hypothetical protein